MKILHSAQLYLCILITNTSSSSTLSLYQPCGCKDCNNSCRGDYHITSKMYLELNLALWNTKYITSKISASQYCINKYKLECFEPSLTLLLGGGWYYHYSATCNLITTSSISVGKISQYVWETFVKVRISQYFLGNICENKISQKMLGKICVNK